MPNQSDIVQQKMHASRKYFANNQRARRVAAELREDGMTSTYNTGLLDQGQILRCELPDPVVAAERAIIDAAVYAACERDKDLRAAWALPPALRDAVDELLRLRAEAKGGEG